MGIAKITVDQDIREILMENRVFSTFTKQSRYQDGFVLNVSAAAVVEPYSGYYGGHNLYSCGAFTYSYTDFDPDQRVGRYCSLAANIRNMSAKHPMEHLSTSHFNNNFSALYRQACEDAGVTEFTSIPYNLGQYELATIGDDVWCGEDVLLGRNIHIGTGAVIAARSIVTKDVPPYAIVAGAPAKIIRFRFPEKLVERLLASEWWRYKFPDFNGMRYSQPELFLEDFEVAKASLVPFNTDTTPLLAKLRDGLLQRGKPVPQPITNALETHLRKETLSKEFPVPSSCTTWYDAERDTRDGQVFRFFGYTAYLDLAAPPSAGYLQFTVPYVVRKDALDKLQLRAFDLPLSLTHIGEDAFQRPVVRFAISEQVARVAGQNRGMRLQLECPVCLVPSARNPSSVDHRKISLAITMPSYD